MKFQSRTKIHKKLQCRFSWRQFSAYGGDQLFTLGDGCWLPIGEYLKLVNSYFAQRVWRFLLEPFFEINPGILCSGIDS